MTQKKPPGTSFSSWIDRQIDKAQKEGAFDNLPGQGKPIEGLGKSYDPEWWVKNLVKREGVSMLPTALRLRRKVERELATIQELDDEARVRERIEALNREIAEANAKVTSGPPTHIGRIDPEIVVVRWRASREAAAEGAESTEGS